MVSLVLNQIMRTFEGCDYEATNCVVRTKKVIAVTQNAASDRLEILRNASGCRLSRTYGRHL